MSLIECKNLSVAYEGKTVVKDLSFAVNSGDSVCIVGENGELHIINFSDWPSFAPCREEAAPHIAKVVLNIVKEHKNKP